MIQRIWAYSIMRYSHARSIRSWRTHYRWHQKYIEAQERYRKIVGQI